MIDVCEDTEIDEFVVACYRNDRNIDYERTTEGSGGGIVMSRILRIQLNNKSNQRFLERESSPDRPRGHIVHDCYPAKKENDQKVLKAKTISYEDFVCGIEKRGFWNTSFLPDRLLFICGSI